MQTNQPSGMVVAQVLDLGHQLAIRAEELETVARHIAGRLEHLRWYGHDATAFKADVLNYLPVLHHTARVLQAFARRAVANAHDQIETSQEDGSRAGPTHPVVPGAIPGGVGGLGLTEDDLSRMQGTLSTGLGFIEWLVLRGGEDLLLRNPLLKFLGPVANVLNGVTIAGDLYDGFTNGWDDRRAGQLTFDAVSWGLGAAGTVVIGMGVAAAASVVGAPAAPFLFAGGAVLTGASIGVSAVATYFPEAVDFVGHGARGGIEAVGDGVEAVWNGAQGVWNAGGDFINGTVDTFRGALEPAGAAVSFVGDVAGNAADAVGDFASGAVDNGKKFLDWVNPF